MRIGLNEVLDFISTRTQIDNKDITFSAYFDAIDTDIERGSSKEDAKLLCLDNFDREKSSGLGFNIYAKGHEIFSFYATDIEPRTNDIFEFMRVAITQSCVGPGFYYNYPYLTLDKKCDKKDFNKFVDAISIDPDKTDVANVVEKSMEHHDFIKSLPQNSVNRSLFKQLKNAKLTEVNASEGVAL